MKELRWVLYDDVGMLGGSMEVRREAVVEAVREFGCEIRSGRDDDEDDIVRMLTSGVMVEEGESLRTQDSRIPGDVRRTGVPECHGIPEQPGRRSTVVVVRIDVSTDPRVVVSLVVSLQVRYPAGWTAEWRFMFRRRISSSI
jgi:hypothetical protein